MTRRVLIILFVFGLLFLGLNIKKNNPPSIPNEKTVRDFKANLTINDGINTYIYTAQEFVGKSAMEATLSLTNGKVEIKTDKKGVFISSINGKAVDTNKREFWELFVNGISSKIPADKYIIKESDQIEWHINLHS